MKRTLLALLLLGYLVGPGYPQLVIVGGGSGGGTPGGANTQCQYNNNGAFGGITGCTTNGTAVTLVAPVLGTPASGVATNLTGTASGLTAGNVTGTGVGSLTSLALGGATIGSNALAVTGLVNFGSAGSAAAPTLSVGNATTGLYSVSTTGLGVSVNGTRIYDYGITTSGQNSFASTINIGTQLSFWNNSATPGVFIASNGELAWANTTNAITGPPDLALWRDAANTLAQRNGTTAQRSKKYNTWTDASNGEWFDIDWITTANIATIGTNKNGTGAARALKFIAGGTAWLDVGTGGVATFVSGPLSSGATAGLGYATGAGGTVTQATDRTTGVTLSKVTGQITTTATSLVALGIVTFTVTNTAVAATDTIILSKVSGDIDTSAWVSAVAAGSFNISLRNNDAVSADTTAFVVNFAVIKGVSS